MSTASLTFEDWLRELQSFTRNNAPTNVWPEEQRLQYYEGQPDAWESWWEMGDSAEAAAREDQTYWEEAGRDE